MVEIIKEEINGQINNEEFENNASIIENPYKVGRAENDIELKQGVAEAKTNAEEVLKDSQTNTNLSENVKERVGLLSKIMAKLSGKKSDKV